VQCQVVDLKPQGPNMQVKATNFNARSGALLDSADEGTT
jgi:hypothetical protein